MHRAGCLRHVKGGVSHGRAALRGRKRHGTHLGSDTGEKRTTSLGRAMAAAAMNIAAVSHSVAAGPVNGRTTSTASGPSNCPSVIALFAITVARPWSAGGAARQQISSIDCASAAAGFPGFTPDACLINRYVPGARLSLHQDKDEQDYGAPIVSVSLGMPAMFLWGGHRRTDKTLRVPLFHGDVVVWGGPDRLRYHGVLPLKEAAHPLLGAQRINLTLRRAG
ncbi:alpha-ketoglutarate-dependent dioxygenase AlkB [Ralstonia pseudosolanacearum]|uniref:alpha-ketoglutarate-dependent dioxygenase AlkB n=1 Tax=Ralstonia pseudosolanacearum TaxID=1310165 RepID=UPI003CFA9391